MSTHLLERQQREQKYSKGRSLSLLLCLAFKVKAEVVVRVSQSFQKMISFGKSNLLTSCVGNRINGFHFNLRYLSFYSSLFKASFGLTFSFFMHPTGHSHFGGAQSLFNLLLSVVCGSTQKWRGTLDSHAINCLKNHPFFGAQLPPNHWIFYRVMGNLAKRISCLTFWFLSTLGKRDFCHI